MELSDFFNTKDLVRSMMLGSALFLIMGAAYGVFLHAQYSSQVDQIKLDLQKLSLFLEDKSNKAFQEGNGEEAREFKILSQRAEEHARMVQSPPINPAAYTYFNYWLASAAFTELHLSPQILGIPENTIQVFDSLSTESVFKEEGWFGRSQFILYEADQDLYRQYLPGLPQLHTYFWSFYVFVFIISVFTIFVGVKEKYELPVIPQIIYGAMMPLPFFFVFTVAAVLSQLSLVPFLDPSQVDLLINMLVLVIMSVLSSVGALIATFIKGKRKKK